MIPVAGATGSRPQALAELPSPWPRVIPKASLVPKAFTGDGRQKPS
jgi:hypothetical protein